MTTDDVIAHWRKGAKDAPRLAALAVDNGVYELALFHCHLAVEKALKAAVMAHSRTPHPKVHALLRLASELGDDWSAEDREMFDTLSDFAIAARYDDPGWAQRFATAENARRWVSGTRAFLSRHSLL